VLSIARRRPRATSKHLLSFVRVSSIKLDAGRKSDSEDNTNHQSDVISRRPAGRTSKTPVIIGLRRISRAWNAWKIWIPAIFDQSSLERTAAICHIIYVFVAAPPRFESRPHLRPVLPYMHRCTMVYT